MHKNLSTFFMIAGMAMGIISTSHAQNELYIGKWSPDTESGNLITDSSGNRNNGKIIKPEWLKGEKRSVLRLGTGSYIEIPDSPVLNPSGALSIEMWISFGGRKNNSWNDIIVKGSDEKSISYGLRDLPGHLYFILYGNKDGKKTYWCWDIKNDYYQDGLFHHLVVTYNGEDSVKFYIDGKNVPILTQMRGDYPEKLSSNNNPLYIGKGFNGFIGDVTMYNIAITDNEIENNYKTNRKNYNFNFVREVTSKNIKNLHWSRFSFNPEWSTGISFLWWYGVLSVFHDEKVKIEISPETLPSFTVSGTGNGIYGVSFPWLKQLEKGTIYKFTLGVSSITIPDIITIGKKIVWKKETGELSQSKTNAIISFLYAPEISENVTINVIKICSKNTQSKLIFPSAVASHEYMAAWKAPLNEPLPQYEKFELPDSIKFLKINPYIACRLHPENGNAPVNYEKKPIVLNELPYETSGIVEMLLFPVPGQLKRNAVTGISQSFGKTVLCGGKGENASLLSLLKQEEIKHICLFWGNLGQSLIKGDKAEIERRNNEVIKNVKLYLSEIPDVKIYIFFAEETGFSYGTWPHGIECSPILYLPQYKDKINTPMPPFVDYDNMTWWPRQKVFKAFPVIQNYLSEFYKDIKAQIGNEKNVQIMFLIDKSLYQPAHIYKANVDIVMNKHIHRENINIVVASNRGESSAYDKKYAFDCDFWDRSYPPLVDLNELQQALYVYFYAGGSYFWDEVDAITKLKDAFSPNAQISRLGAVHLDFCRYSASHVKLGEQKSLIGIMRGSGDEWGIGGITSPSNDESQPLGAEWKRRLFRDFNLLNIVFPNYGNYYRTFTDRLCTGTPYGPVNMIPWDIPLDKMEKYKVIFFLGGPNAMDNKQYENLKKYVENGGILVMAAGQLRKEDGSFYKTDISDLFGVKLGDARRLHYPMRESLITEDPKEYPYTYLDVVGTNAEVRFRLTDSSPWVVENRLGKGKTYLFSTEHIVQYGDAPAMDIMKSELEKTKWLTFSPESSWLEYMVQKKGNCYILPIFNHGNVGFPSGNGKKTGPWNGKVTLDLDKFEFPKGELAVYESIYVPDEKIPYKLVKIDSVQENGKLSFDIKIDKFSEIVIGQEGKVEKEYFSPKNSK